ncbi:MAG TPA: prephenate dehydratase [Polyangia bacterium]|jgi:prephenate dehydratase
MRSVRVAIQGAPGCFSHEAARRLLPGCRVAPCPSFAAVFDCLDDGDAGAAVVPIENTLFGSLAENLDLLLARDVFVRRELRLRIEHHLVAAPGVRGRDVRRILSHPAALQQCRRFLRRHPRLAVEPFYDTAGAVRHVMEHHLLDAAAIAGDGAALQYGAAILKRGLEDDTHNSTRFFLVTKDRRVARGANKTSLAFATRDVAGALFKALAIFAVRDINLTRIESRPARDRPWEYVFFVDFMRGADEAARNALRHLGEIARSVKVLGIYPAAEQEA